MANTRFRGRTDLLLLHVDESRVGAEVRRENLEGGQWLFPHIYGPLPVAAVPGVTPLVPAADGTFDLDAPALAGANDAAPRSGDLSARLP